MRLLAEAAAAAKIFSERKGNKISGDDKAAEAAVFLDKIDL